MEDKAIVELYWMRSDKAIFETELKYGKYCRTIANNICGIKEDAEECVNDTWLRAWNLMPDNRPEILSSFLGRITRNFALDKLKAKKRLKRGGGEISIALSELNECVPDRNTPQLDIEYRELEKAIARFVSSLPETEKKIFI